MSEATQLTKVANRQINTRGIAALEYFLFEQLAPLREAV
jgi:hypothetical protein